MKKNEDLFKMIELLDSKITYNDFFIDEHIPFQEQIYAYKEDLLQITCGDNLLIDVGWYPSMDPKGRFVIYIIQDYDWQHPLTTLRCGTLNDLKKNIESAITMIRKASHK